MDKKVKKEIKITGADYLYLALYAFAGIGLELVLINLIEPLFGMEMATYTTAQHVVHLLMTSIVWLLAALFLIWLSKTRYQFDIWENKCRLQTWQYIGIVVCVVISVLAHYVDWEGFKPYLELQSKGTIRFIFQYIYYVFEAFLFTLIIVFGQKACETWFKNDKIPYGGIVLALTWGLMHIVTKGSIAAGILTAFSGFLFGAAYLVVGKDFRKALPLMCVMFML